MAEEVKYYVNGNLESVNKSLESDFLEANPSAKRALPFSVDGKTEYVNEALSSDFLEANPKAKPLFAISQQKQNPAIATPTNASGKYVVQPREELNNEGLQYHSERIAKFQKLNEKLWKPYEEAQGVFSKMAERVSGSPGGYASYSVDTELEKKSKSAKAFIDANKKNYDEYQRQLAGLKETAKPAKAAYRKNIIQPLLQKTYKEIEPFETNLKLQALNISPETGQAYSPMQTQVLLNDRQKLEAGNKSNIDRYTTLRIRKEALQLMDKELAMEEGGRSFFSGLVPKENFSGRYLEGLGANITTIAGLGSQLDLKRLFDKANTDPKSLTPDEQLAMYAKYMADTMPSLTSKTKGAKLGEAVGGAVPIITEFMLTAPIGGAAGNVAKESTLAGITKLIAKMPRFAEWLAANGVEAERITNAYTKLAAAEGKVVSSTLTKAAQKEGVKLATKRVESAIRGVEKGTVGKIIEKGAGFAAQTVGQTAAQTAIMPSTIESGVMATVPKWDYNQKTGETGLKKGDSFASGLVDAAVSNFNLNLFGGLSQKLTSTVMKGIGYSGVSKAISEETEAWRKSWTKRMLETSTATNTLVPDAFKSTLGLYSAGKATEAYQIMKGNGSWEDWKDPEKNADKLLEAAVFHVIHGLSVAKNMAATEISLKFDRNSMAKDISSINVDNSIKSQITEATSAKTVAETAKKMKVVMDNPDIPATEKQKISDVVSKLMAYRIKQGLTTTDLQRMGKAFDPEKFAAAMQEADLHYNGTEYSDGKHIRVQYVEPIYNTDGTVKLGEDGKPMMETKISFVKDGAIVFDKDGRWDKDNTGDSLSVIASGDKADTRIAISKEQILNAETLTDKDVAENKETYAANEASAPLNDKTYYEADAAKEKVINEVKNAKSDSKFTQYYESIDDIPEMLKGRVEDVTESTPAPSDRVGSFGYGKGEKAANLKVEITGEEAKQLLDTPFEKKVEEQAIATKTKEEARVSNPELFNKDGKIKAGRKADVEKLMKGETLFQGADAEVKSTPITTDINTRLTRFSDSEAKKIAEELGLATHTKEELAKAYNRGDKNVVDKIDETLKNRKTKVANITLTEKEESIVDDILMTSPKKDGLPMTRSEVVYSMIPLNQMARTFANEVSRTGESFTVEDFYDQFYGGVGKGELAPNGSLKQIIGEKGASALDMLNNSTTIIDNLSVARQMESSDKTPKEIRIATGWEKGVDGKWKYEIEYLKLKDDTTLSRSKKLGSLVDAPELFAAYPELAEVTVKEMSSGEHFKTEADALFDVNENEIRIYTKDGFLDGDRFTSKLVHEIQHAIQEIEGFSKGGNLSTFKDSSVLESKELKSILGKITSIYLSMTKEQRSNIKSKYEEEGLRRIPIIPTYHDIVSADPFKMIEIIDKYEILNELFPTENVFSDILNILDIYADTNPYESKSFSKYKRLSGETESRNAESRMRFNEEQRRNNLLSETADIDPEDQIILFQNAGITKGFITFDGSKGFVGLMEKADASTILHEFSGHIGEQVALKLVEKLEALRKVPILNEKGEPVLDKNGKPKFKYNGEKSDFVKAHEQAMKDIGMMVEVPSGKKSKSGKEGRTWVAETDPAKQVAAREKFARGFEQYIATGKAASLALSNVYATLKKWLLKIYDIAIDGKIDNDKLKASDIGSVSNTESGRVTKNMEKVYSMLLDGTGLEAVDKGTLNQKITKNFDAIDTKITKAFKDFKDDVTDNQTQRIATLTNAVNKILIEHKVELSEKQRTAILKKTLEASKNPDKVDALFEEARLLAKSNAWANEVALIRDGQVALQKRMDSKGFYNNFSQYRGQIRFLMNLDLRSLEAIGNERLVRSLRNILFELSKNGKITTSNEFKSTQDIVDFIDYMRNIKNFTKINPEKLSTEQLVEYNKLKESISDSSHTIVKLDEFLQDVVNNPSSKSAIERFDKMQEYNVPEENRAEYKSLKTSVAEIKSKQAELATLKDSQAKGVLNDAGIAQIATLENEIKSFDTKRLNDFLRKPRNAEPKDLNELEAIVDEKMEQPKSLEELSAYASRIGRLKKSIDRQMATVTEETKQEDVTKLENLSNKVDAEYDKLFDENGKLKDSSLREQLIKQSTENSAQHLAEIDMKRNSYSSGIEAEIARVEGVMNEVERGAISFSDLRLTDKEVIQLENALYNINKEGVATQDLIKLARKIETAREVYTKNGQRAVDAVNESTGKFTGLKESSWTGRKQDRVLVNKLLTANTDQWNIILAGSTKDFPISELLRPADRLIIEMDNIKDDMKVEYFKAIGAVNVGGIEIAGMSDAQRKNVNMLRTAVHIRRTNQTYRFNDLNDAYSFTGTWQEMMDSKEVPQELKDLHSNVFNYLAKKLEKEISETKKHNIGSAQDKKRRELLKEYNRFNEQNYDLSMDNPSDQLNKVERKLYDLMGSIGDRLSGMVETNAILAGRPYKALDYYHPLEVVEELRVKGAKDTTKNPETILDSKNYRNVGDDPSTKLRTQNFNYYETDPSLIFPQRINDTVNYRYIGAYAEKINQTMDMVRNLAIETGGWRAERVFVGTKENPSVLKIATNAKIDREAIEQVRFNWIEKKWNQAYQAGMSTASYYALLKMQRLPAEYLSNVTRVVMEAGIKNPLDLIPADKEGWKEFTKEFQSIIANQSVPYIEMTRNKVEAVGARWAQNQIKWADGAVAPVVFIKFFNQKLMDTDGRKVDVRNYTKGYRLRVENLNGRSIESFTDAEKNLMTYYSENRDAVEDAISFADTKVESLFASRTRITTATHSRLLPLTKPIDANNKFASSFKWFTRFLAADSFHMSHGAKLIGDYIEDPMNVDRGRLAIQGASVITSRMASNTMYSYISQLGLTSIKAGMTLVTGGNIIATNPTTGGLIPSVTNGNLDNPDAWNFFWSEVYASGTEIEDPLVASAVSAFFGSYATVYKTALGNTALPFAGWAQQQLNANSSTNVGEYITRAFDYHSAMMVGENALMVRETDIINDKKTLLDWYSQSWGNLSAFGKVVGRAKPVIDIPGNLKTIKMLEGMNSEDENIKRQIESLKAENARAKWETIMLGLQLIVKNPVSGNVSNTIIQNYKKDYERSDYKKQKENFIKEKTLEIANQQYETPMPSFSGEE